MGTPKEGHHNPFSMGGAMVKSYIFEGMRSAYGDYVPINGMHGLGLAPKAAQRLVDAAKVRRSKGACI